MIAIENVRLFDEVQARTRELAQSVEELRALGEVTQAVNSTLDLQTVLDTIVAKAAQLSGTEAGAIYVLDERQQGIPAARDLRHERGADRRGARTCMPRFPTAVGHATETHEPEQAADLRDLPPTPVQRHHLAAPAIGRGCWCRSLRSGEVVGALVVRRKTPGEFPDKHDRSARRPSPPSRCWRSRTRACSREIEDKSRQLAEASEHKSQFVSSMSHELRTPLNAIIGLTEMMVTNAARFGTEKAQEPLQRVHRAGTHLLGLINQVLDLSKIEAGKLELNPQTVQLAPLIDEVIGTARQLAEQNKNRLVVEVQENLGTLTVDPMRLRQILLNLLSNACKFTKEGEVKLRARRVSERPRLGRAVRLRHRHRHDAGAAGEAVRGIHPGRRHDRAALRRHRARPRHHPQARAHDGRRRDRDERAGQGLGLYGAPAGRRGYLECARSFTYP